MTRAATTIKSFKALLIKAPTSKPMMNGTTTGMSQAIAGGIDMVIPRILTFYHINWCFFTSGAFLGLEPQQNNGAF